MKHLKTFESYETPMSREDMYQYLNKCGYQMEVLVGCPTEELEEICKICMAEESMPVQEKRNVSKVRK